MSKPINKKHCYVIDNEVKRCSNIVKLIKLLYIYFLNLHTVQNSK